jgi:hypothetical protein
MFALIFVIVVPWFHSSSVPGIGVVVSCDLCRPTRITHSYPVLYRLPPGVAVVAPPCLSRSHPVRSRPLSCFVLPIAGPSSPTPLHRCGSVTFPPTPLLHTRAPPPQPVRIVRPNGHPTMQWYGRPGIRPHTCTLTISYLSYQPIWSVPGLARPFAQCEWHVAHMLTCP